MPQISFDCQKLHINLITMAALSLVSSKHTQIYIISWRVSQYRLLPIYRVFQLKTVLIGERLVKRVIKQAMSNNNESVHSHIHLTGTTSSMLLRINQFTPTSLPCGKCTMLVSVYLLIPCCFSEVSLSCNLWSADAAKNHLNIRDSALSHQTLASKQGGDAGTPFCHLRECFSSAPFS